MTFSYYYGERKETKMGVRFEQISTYTWNINNEYDANTRVKYGDYWYVAKVNVPKGVNIGMSDYWKKCDDISSLDSRLDTAESDIDTLQSDVTSLDGRLDTAEGKIGTLETNVGAIATCITTEISETPVVFQFAYEDGVYGFMVGETFHPFGGEVAPTNGEG